ncbi:MAG: hypothetical protein AB1705_10200 [Verrucomicrobiota bacterium]
MFEKRKAFNPKRRIASSIDRTQLEALANRVRYGGNPEHKRNPGDFGLTPPFLPRPDKTLCDLVGIFRRAEAERLLREGIRQGLVSQWGGAGFPQNVWAVTEEGFPLEAQLENAGNGTYHGYPMPEDDAFREQVIEKWRAPRV